MPISTNAPNAVILLTIPGSIIPIDRSPISFTLLSNSNTAADVLGSRPVFRMYGGIVQRI